jgi:hypothetical protein
MGVEEPAQPARLRAVVAEVVAECRLELRREGKEQRLPAAPCDFQGAGRGVADATPFFHMPSRS